MATSTTELILKFSGDSRSARGAVAQLRAELSKDEGEQKRIAATLTQTWKSSELSKTQAARQAQSEIKRMERERAQIATQNARAIESLAKSEANARIREGKRAANEAIRLLREEAAERRALASQIGTASGATSSFLAGAAGGLTAIVGVSAISEIRAAGAAWLDYSNKLETTRIAFTTMLGSEQLAEQHLKELQQFALKTPFQFGELIDASQRMQALGFNAQQVIPILTDVGNAVAAAGGGSERLDRVVLAISQIQSKGKVATQELNQLAEAGIPAFRILQESLGKSGAEVRKLVEDGKIFSNVFIDAFQKFSQVNFGGLMEQQSRTFSGAMSNIKDALLQTSATAFEPLFKKLSETAKAFADAATSSKDFQDKLKVVGDVSATIFDGLVEVILAVRDAVRLVVAAITAQFTLFIEGARAIGHALTAVFFQSLAVGKALRGDFEAAARAQRIAQQELKLATDSAAKAFNAQGEVVKTLSGIYREAEARAKALTKAQLEHSQIELPRIFQKNVSPVSPSPPSDDTTSKTKGSDPAQAAKRIAEIQLRAVLDGIQLEEEGIERSLRKREIEYAHYVAEIEVLENKRHQSVLGGLVAEERAAEQLRDANARRVALAEIEARRVQENNKHQSELNKLKDKTFDRDKQIADALEGFHVKQVEQLRQIIQGNKTLLDETNEFITAYEKMGGVLDENQKKWLRFDAVLIEARKHMEELSESIINATQEGLGPPTPEFPTLTPEQIAASAGAVASAGAGTPPPEIGFAGDAFTELGGVIQQTLGLAAETASTFGNLIADTFGEVAQGVGAAVRAFVLFGTAQGGFKRFAAEVIASVAQMSIVQAVFEAAQGLAMLALTFFTGNPKYAASANAHFLAAAVFGAIGGVAAIAGRAVAGNSFNQSTGGNAFASQGSGSGGSGSSAPAGPPKTVELDRATQNQQAIHVFLEVKRDEGSIVNAVVSNHRNNGEIRQMVLSEIGG